MSLDRRIVSILYFNGISDVESVENFLGEKKGYYEIIINGEIKKLKIPGRYYPAEKIKKEEIKTEDKKEEIKEKIKVKKEKIKKEDKKIDNILPSTSNIEQRYKKPPTYSTGG